MKLATGPRVGPSFAHSIVRLETFSMPRLSRQISKSRTVSTSRRN